MNQFARMLIEVLGATIPVFVVIAIGFFIKKRGIIQESHVPLLNRLTYDFGLSALVFTGIIKNDFNDIFAPDILKVIFSSYFVFILLVFLSFYFTKLSPNLKSAAIVSSYRCNMAFVGIPVLLYAFGSLATAKASIVIALLLPLNIVSTALFFQFINKPGSDFKIKELLRQIFTDPVIIAVILGLLISFFKVAIPGPLNKVFEILSNLAVPLALISIGASFKFFYIRRNIKFLLIISFAKLLLLPLISFVFSTYVFKVGILDRNTICILFATPVAVATYIQSRKYLNDSNFISSIIIISTLASALTISLWLLVLKLI